MQHEEIIFFHNKKVYEIKVWGSIYDNFVEIQDGKNFKMAAIELGSLSYRRF